MLKYVIILLDKISVSFCHADNPYTEPSLIPIKTLKEAIFWAMKENLMIQFVYPDYDLPQEYLDVIDKIDHVDIRSDENGDICVVDGLASDCQIEGKIVVARVSCDELMSTSPKYESLKRLYSKAERLSIIIKDVENINENYRDVLKALSLATINAYKNDKTPQLNILTDRLVLNSMNNCNAGAEVITIAPNGKFYICPAFYYEDENDAVGSLSEGLNIKNPQLYALSHAPICRNCDAYQCRRCVWLNRKLTYEVNTPSKQQCEMAHLERNASRELLLDVRKYGEFLPHVDILQIDYLDPLDKIIKK